MCLRFNYSELHAVLLAPLHDHLHEVLCLGVLGVLHHLHHLDKSLLVLLTRDYHLEHSDGGPSLAFPELWVGVQSFQNVEGLHRVVELPHFVAVIRDKVQK